jgi:hypothetical protein
MNCKDLPVSTNNLNAFLTSSTATVADFRREAERKLGAIKLSAYRREEVAPMFVSDSNASSSKVTSSSVALEKKKQID